MKKTKPGNKKRKTTKKWGGKRAENERDKGAGEKRKVAGRENGEQT